MERFRRPGAAARPAWPHWLPAALLLCAGVVGLLEHGANTFPLLAAVPVAAAAVLSLGGTIAMGVAATVLGMLLLRLEGTSILDRAGGIAFASLTVLTVVAVFLNRAFVRERNRLRTTREVAEAVQRAVLPPVPAHVGGLAVAYRYQAAQKEASIGGDLYAVHDTPYGVRVLIADVRGKGVPAVATVNALLGTFRTAALYVPELPGVVRALEAQMREAGAEEEGAMSESFATAVVAETSLDRSVLRLANRGHPAPLLVHDGRVTPLEPELPSLPLGLAHLDGPEVRVDPFPLPPGATLLMFTDGITEARDGAGAFFDPAPALTRPLPPDPEAVLDALLSALREHTDDLDDDAAVLALTRHPADDPGTGAGTDPLWLP